MENCSLYDSNYTVNDYGESEEIVMDLVLRIAFFISTLVLVFIIFRTISRKSLSVRYALMWLLFSFVLLYFVIAPNIVEQLSDLLNFETASNMVFVLTMACVILMLLSITTIVSKQATQIQSLLQEVAILKCRVDEMDDSVE